VPTAVIGGFLALALGPEGVGRIGDSNGVFPDQTFAVWTALPALLINVMSASLRQPLQATAVRDPVSRYLGVLRSAVDSDEHTGTPTLERR